MTHSPDLRQSLPLDGQIGPATRISRARAKKMIDRAVTRAAVGERVTSPLSIRRWRGTPCVVAIAFALPLTLVARCTAREGVSSARSTAVSPKAKGHPQPPNARG
jgi:hypothetical protein